MSPLDLKSVREDYPVTKNWIYFNTGFFGPISRHVVEAVKTYLDECCSKGMGSYEVFAKALRERERARKELATLMNAKPEEMAITTRATEGINLVVKSIKWEKGDKIVINDQEYTPTKILWDYIKQSYGVETVTVKATAKGLIDPSDVEKVIDEKTKLISMCHVTFDTGTILPAREIGKIANDHNVLYLLDGAQAVGAMEVDVKELGCHFYAIAGQKSLGAGEGTGALYFEKDAGKRLTPLITSGSYTSHFVPGLEKVEAADVFSSDGVLLPPYRFETASLNYPGIVGLAKATEYLNRIGIRNVEKRIRKLVASAFESLERLPHTRLVGTSDVDRRIFASFEIADIPHATVTAALEKEKIIARALKNCVRACFHIINTEEEISALESALAKLQ